MSPTQNRGMRVLQPEPTTNAGLIAAVQWLATKLASREGSGVVVFNTIQQIRESIFARAFKLDGRQLAKRRGIPLPVKGTTVEVPLQTASTLDLHPSVTAIVLLWPSESTLASVDEWARSADVLVVCWSQLSRVTCESRFGYIDINAAQYRLPDNPTIQGAVQWLTRQVNVSTGIANPRDRETFVEMLHALRDSGELIDPDQIMRAALACGWGGDRAHDLHEQATRFVNGVAIRRGAIRLQPGVAELWKSEGGT